MLLLKQCEEMKKIQKNIHFLLKQFAVLSKRKKIISNPLEKNFRWCYNYKDNDNLE